MKYPHKKKIGRGNKKRKEFAMKLTEMKNVGLANDEIRKQLEETTNNLTPNKQKLNRLINDAAHQRKKKERNERSYF